MNPQGLIDYHIHTAVTVDAHMTVAQACQRAVDLGLQEIAFTNHIMLYYPNYTIFPEELADHWSQIQSCQQQYPHLTIRLGLEMDYYEGREDEIAATIARYEDLIGRRFDFILGAVHRVHGVRFSSRSEAPALFDKVELEPLFLEFFRLMAKAVRCRLFNVMAHPDLIKKFTGELYPPLPFDRYHSAAQTFIDSLLDTGVGLEINASGLKNSVGELYPSAPLLSLYISQAQARGIDPIITLGSDAHRAENVGAHLVLAAKALRDAGCNTITRFEKREQVALSI